MKMFKMNKKGFMQIVADILIAFLVVFVGLLILSFLAGKEKVDRIEKGRRLMDQAVGENAIASYLRTPVKLPEGSIVSMAELLVFSIEDNQNYGSIWETATKNYFSTQGPFWSLTIAKPGVGTPVVEIRSKVNTKAGLNSHTGFKSSINLPSHNSMYTIWFTGLMAYSEDK